MIPHRTPFFLPMIYPSLHWRWETDKKELFLTFDDGPVPGPTEFVLSVLKDFSIKATFFCIGENVHKHPEIAASIAAEGHQLANHTFHHMNGWKSNVKDYVSNVAACDEIIKPYLPGNGNKKLFRPPYGRITKKQIKELSDYAIIMWDVLSVDYNRNVSPEACLRNTFNVTRPGSVIVFHDSIKARRNMEYTLPRFIKQCLDEGYSFKSIVL